MKSIGLKHSLKQAIAFSFLIFFSLSSIKDASGQESVCDRSYAVYITLAQALSRGDCFFITAADLATITTIRLLRNRGLDSLQEGDLDDLVNLEVLHLSGNNFERLPDNLFRDLTNLKKLYIFDNQLTDLPDLSALTNLEVLNASQNNLRSFPDLPQNSALKILNVRNNIIFSFPDFTSMPNLQYLDMGNNNLWRNRPDFSSSTNITHLFLNDNLLTTFPDISPLESLQVLDLSVNYLNQDDFEQDYFFHNRALRGVNLAGNPRRYVSSYDPFTVVVPEPFVVRVAIHQHYEEPETHNARAELSHYLPIDSLSVDVAIEGGVPSSNSFHFREGSRRVTFRFETEPGEASVRLRPSISSASTFLNGYTETVTTESNTPRNGSGYSGFDIQGDSVTFTTGICDRTQQVQDAILAQLPTITDCSDVSNLDLTQLIALSLNQKRLTSLKSIDFLGLRVLRELNLSHNSLNSDVPEGLFSDLTSLTELNLSHNSLSSGLAADLFAGLTSLTELNLSNNSLSSGLAADLFDGLTSLTELNLSHNSLGNADGGENRGVAVPADLFAGLSSLRELNLSNNLLGRSTQAGGSSVPLPETLFAGLSSLTTLNLANNQIGIISSGNTNDTDLPNSIHTDLSSLTNLDLENNNLHFIPDTLSRMTTLRRLNLTNNSIVGRLSSDTFRNLRNLEILRLNDNLLTELPEDIFVGLESLRTLWLDNNPKGSNSEDFTLTLIPKQTNELSQNELSQWAITVREGAPANLSAEVTITGGLRFRVRETIATGTNEVIFPFAQTHPDATLTLSDPVVLPRPRGNSETGYTGLVIEVVETPLTLGGICDRTPEVQAALLEKISSVTDCQDVTRAHLEAVDGTLDLSYLSTHVSAHLTILKEWDFRHLRRLEGLNLSGNRLSVWLSSFDDDLINLRELDVSSNLLRNEFDVTGLTELRRLNVSRNRFTSLTDVEGLSKLTHFDASWNDLTNLPNLSALTEIRHFNASRNDLTEGLPALSPLTKVEHFDISYNDVMELPAVSALTEVRHFDISNNELTELPAVSALTKVEHFDISSNDFITLPPLSALTKMTYFDASWNDLVELPSLSTLTELLYFDVSENFDVSDDSSLMALPDLTQLTKLTNLDASGNDLTVFPDLTGLTSLTRLDLSRNRIGELPSGAFDGLSALEIILLSVQRLDKFTARDLRWLRVLDDAVVGRESEIKPSKFHLDFDPGED